MISKFSSPNWLLLVVGLILLSYSFAVPLAWDTRRAPQTVGVILAFRSLTGSQPKWVALLGFALAITVLAASEGYLPEGVSAMILYTGVLAGCSVILLWDRLERN
jgi:hypothetical protein